MTTPLPTVEQLTAAFDRENDVGPWESAKLRGIAAVRQAMVDAMPELSKEGA